MIDEQIRDGDFVVVNERQRADNGEMVIAMLARQLGDGEEVLPRARRTHSSPARERDDGADLRPRERHHDSGHRRRRDAALLSGVATAAPVEYARRMLFERGGAAAAARKRRASRRVDATSRVASRASPARRRAPPAAFSTTAALRRGVARRPSSTAVMVARVLRRGPARELDALSLENAVFLGSIVHSVDRAVAHLDDLRRAQRRDLVHPRLAVHDQRVRGPSARERARDAAAPRRARPRRPPAAPRPPDSPADRRCSSPSGSPARGAPGPTWRIAGCISGANMNTMPASSSARAIDVDRHVDRARRAPRARRRCPHCEVNERLPCFAIRTPAPAASSAAAVEMLNVRPRRRRYRRCRRGRRTAAAGKRTIAPRSARAAPATSSAVSPFTRRPMSSAAICAAVASPRMTIPNASRRQLRVERIAEGEAADRRLERGRCRCGRRHAVRLTRHRCSTSRVASRRACVATSAMTSARSRTRSTSSSTNMPCCARFVRLTTPTSSPW